MCVCARACVPYQCDISVEVRQQLLSTELGQQLQSWGETWDEMWGRLVLLHPERGGVPAEEEEEGETEVITLMPKIC